PAPPPQKRVLVFGPEPLDAELGMAGTLHRLCRHRHEVTFAYLTSGNLGVPDNEARMAISLLNELSVDGPSEAHGRDRLRQLSDELEKKAPFDEDSPILRQFKGLIRKAEARASCQILGLELAKVLFLNLPFYEKGRYRQFDSTDADVTALRELCQRIQPHQIYVTGSGAEPGSVSGISFRLVASALEECKAEA